MIIEVVDLPPGGASFFRQLTAGVALAAAVDGAARAETRFNLSTNLAILLRSIAFTTFSQETTDEDRHHT